MAVELYFVVGSWIVNSLVHWAVIFFVVVSLFDPKDCLLVRSLVFLFLFFFIIYVTF